MPGCVPANSSGASLAELNALAETRAAPRRDTLAPALERDLLGLLKSHNASALQHALASQLMREGLQRFVLNTVVPLHRAVGEMWMRGELQVFEEHLFTEQLHVAHAYRDQHLPATVRSAPGAADHASRASSMGSAC